MIQRIQTIYLLIAAICGLILFFTPLFTLVPGELSVLGDTFRFFLSGVIQINKDASLMLVRHWPLILILALAILLQVYAIFQYKKRPLQVSLVRYSTIILLAFCGLSTYYTLQLRRLAPGHVYKFEYGWILVGVIFIAAFLAIRAIKKDEALVRSADRLR
jgi:hypothetical protein